jgi:hypothetical protein
MAQGGNEHRMLFDLQRGRRRTAVKVVYAILAVLMGFSLFLVVGPLNIGELFNSSGSSSTDAAQPYEEQAERLEVKLKRDPENPDLLGALTRAHINAGNTLVVINPETGERGSTRQSRQEYEEAVEAWSRYVKAADKPSPNVAQVVAPAFVALTLASKTVPEAKRNLREAVAAQQMVAEARPSRGSISTLAIYQYFNGETKAAEKAEKELLGLTHAKFEREELEKQFESTSQQGAQQQALYKRAEKEEEQAAKAGGGGAGSLSSPSLGGSLGGSAFGE